MKHYLLKMLLYIIILHILCIYIYLFSLKDDFLSVQNVLIKFFFLSNFNCWQSVMHKDKTWVQKVMPSSLFWISQTVIHANNNTLIIYLTMSAIRSYRHRQVSIILSYVFRRTRRTSWDGSWSKLCSCTRNSLGVWRSF